MQESIFFAAISIMIGLSLRLIGLDLLNNVSFLLPNYVISSPYYLYHQVMLNDNYARRYGITHNSKPIGLINFRKHLVSRISEVVTIVIWSLLSPIICVVCSFIPFIGPVVQCLVNGIGPLEFRLSCSHFRFEDRLNYYRHHLWTVGVFGLPFSVLQSMDIDWFTKHHILNVMMQLMIGVTWSHI